MKGAKSVLPAVLATLLVALACQGRRDPREPDLSLKPLTVSSTLCPSRVTARTSAALPLGGGRDLTLSPGNFDFFNAELRKGDFLGVRANQGRVDLVLCLYNSENQLLLPVDRPTGKERPEELACLAPAAGRFSVGIKAFDAGGHGSYRLEAEKAAVPDQMLTWRAEAVTATALAEVWQRQSEPTDAAKAEDLFQLALARWQLLGDGAEKGDALYRLGYLKQTIQRDPIGARSALERALPLLEAYGGSLAKAQAHAELGQALLSLGRAQASSVHLRAASNLFRQLGETSSYGATLNELASAHQMLGEYQEALEGYAGAIEIFRSLGEPSKEAAVLHNRGVVTSILGRDREAEDDLLSAMQLWRVAPQSLEVREGTVRTLTSLGSIDLARGDTEAALRYFQESLPLRRELGDAAGEAITLGYIGLVEQRLGRFSDALEHHRAAVFRLGQLPLPCVKARALKRLGDALYAADDFNAARASLREARSEARQCNDPFLESSVLASSAQTERRAGDLVIALEHSLGGLSLVEKLREGPQSPFLRSAFFATIQRHYDLSIDLLMDLAQREPNAGYERKALDLFERDLARSLLDLVRQEGGSLRRNVPPSLVARKRWLQASLRRRLRELSTEAPFGNEDIPERDGRIRALLRELDEIETAVFRSSTGPSGLGAVSPLSVEQIQHQVLDRETLALYYRLGRDQSYLWALGHDSLKSFRLPGRDYLETLARRAHDLLASDSQRGGDVQLELTLKRLSELLLKPIGPQIGSKRLVIISDGDLQLVPFAVLPSPASSDRQEPLLVTHEILNEPSLSVVAALEQTSPARQRPIRRLAIFADPVFSARDPRVQRTAVAETQGHSAPIATYSRLPFSRREAEQISRLLPQGDVHLRLDFDASRKYVEDGSLRDYGVLHFATHSAANGENPALSQIVLSLVDPTGAPIDGTLHAYEIRDLDLSADLVVLSSCDSGLGKEIRGEGVEGLPYAFFDAGAKRVVASLWEVEDEETAVLMSRFYSSYLLEGLSPAAALRKAQIEQWKVSPASHSWSTFFIQGPWR